MQSIFPIKMDIKKLSVLAGLALLTGVGATNPRPAEAAEVKPVDRSLLRKAIKCVLEAKPGDTVKSVDEDYVDENSRRIVVIGHGHQYTVDASKSYPSPLIKAGEHTVEEIPVEGFARVEYPSLQIYQRPYGKTKFGEYNLYQDGGARVRYHNGVPGFLDYNPDDPYQLARAELEHFQSQARLDGIADRASLMTDPSTPSRIDMSLPEELQAEIDSRNQARDRQEFYRKAIEEIVNACDRN